MNAGMGEYTFRLDESMTAAGCLGGRCLGSGRMDNPNDLQNKELSAPQKRISWISSSEYILSE